MKLKIYISCLLIITMGTVSSCSKDSKDSKEENKSNSGPSGNVPNSLVNHSTSDYPSYATYTSAVKASIISHNFLNGVGNVILPTGEQLLKASYLLSLFYAKVNALTGSAQLVISPDEQAQFATLNLQVFSLAISGSTYYGVEEKNPKIYGHGVAMMKSDFSSMTNKLLVEVPHPIWDTNTGELGGEVIDAMKPALFIIAGHHRYNSTQPATTTLPGNSGEFRSDAAHETALFFHVAHSVFAQDITYVLQLHGYGSGQTTLYSATPPVELVLASGMKQNPPAILTTLKTAFTAAGMTGSIYPTDTTVLGATDNVQGIHTRESFPDRFIHLETRTELRSNATERARIVNVLKAVL